jgi:hypothetical protein
MWGYLCAWIHLNCQQQFCEIYWFLISMNPTQKFLCPPGLSYRPKLRNCQDTANTSTKEFPMSNSCNFFACPPKKLFFPPALSLSPFMYRCRSLRKVMLRTCLDTADTSTKEFPTATSTTPATVQPSQATSYSAEKAIYDNGDIFGNKTTDNTVYRQTIAFTDQIPIPIPEDIPGLPIHRPGEYSPSYDRRSTRG